MCIYTDTDIVCLSVCLYLSIYGSTYLFIYLCNMKCTICELVFATKRKKMTANQSDIPCDLIVTLCVMTLWKDTNTSVYPSAMVCIDHLMRDQAMQGLYTLTRMA